MTMHSWACAVARPYAARSNRWYHCVPPGGDGLRRWENQRMLLSSTYLLNAVVSLVPHPKAARPMNSQQTRR